MTQKEFAVGYYIRKNHYNKFKAIAKKIERSNKVKDIKDTLWNVKALRIWSNVNTDFCLFQLNQDEEGNYLIDSLP